MASKTVLKRIGNTILWGMVLAGFIVLLVAANNDKDAGKCKSIVVKMNGADDNFFIEEKDIRSLLTKDKNINPIGKTISDINIAGLEKVVSRDPWVKSADIYFDSRQRLYVKITQREPVARVFTFSGNSFYLDESGERIPVSARYAARVPVFTGFPTDAEHPQQADSLLTMQTVELGTFIGKDPFWMAQVEQLLITGDRKFEFIPKLGDHVVVFGDGSNIEKKFGKLLAFYKEGLSKVGWNNYTRINIAYENEVVCTRRDGVDPLQPTIKQDSLKLAAADEPPIEPEDPAAEHAPVKAPEPTPAAVKPEKTTAKPEKAAVKTPASKARTPVKTKAKEKEKEKKTVKPKTSEKDKGKEKTPATPKQQPKAVYKPGNKSVNTSKNNTTP